SLLKTTRRLGKVVRSLQTHLATVLGRARFLDFSRKASIEVDAMARKLIDISVPLQNDVPADPPGGHPTIQYINHQQGLPRMLQFFEGLKAEDLPDGQGWAVEQVQL